MHSFTVRLVIILAVLGTSRVVQAQEPFSRTAFLNAMKAAAQTESWNELIWIPQLSAVTDGKKAGYVLALAYLASQECGPAIARVNESRSYLVLKADGLFTAYGYDSANPAHVASRRALENMDMRPRTQLTFASAFQSAASQLLKKSISISEGGCDFPSGWTGNDPRQIDFLRRTCTELRQVLYPDMGKAKDLAAAQVKSEMADAIGNAATAAETDEQEVARRAKLSPDELQRGLNAIYRKIEETQVRRNSIPRSGGKVFRTTLPSTAMSQQDRQTQVELLNAQIRALRHEESLQVAALRIAEGQAKKEREAERIQEEIARAAAKKADIEAYMQSQYGKEAFDACLAFRQRWQPQQARELAQLGMPPIADGVYKTGSSTTCREFLTEYLRGYEKIGPLVWRSILDFLKTGKRIPYEQPRLDVDAFLMRSGVLFGPAQ